MVRLFGLFFQSVATRDVLRRTKKATRQGGFRVA
jgi:hypothetical protein